MVLSCHNKTRKPLGLHRTVPYAHHLSILTLPSNLTWVEEEGEEEEGENDKSADQLEPPKAYEEAG